MATGGAEQERKGAPRCVRVSVPVSPDLCLSDRQRREKRQERREEVIQPRQEERSLLVPNLNQTEKRGWWGVGGCIVKSSQQAGGLCLQVKPRGRKKKKEEKEEREKQFSADNSPITTLSRNELSKTSKQQDEFISQEIKSKNEQHFVLFLMHTGFQIRAA